MVALYEYKAQRSDELDLQMGDEILVIIKENDSWWMGQLVRSGRDGYFPASYVQEKSHNDLIAKSAARSVLNKKKHRKRLIYYNIFVDKMIVNSSLF